jgi:hypothetical protein
MNATQARARLERMLQWQSAPALSADEVTDLLDLARVADVWGAAPDDQGWEPTWDLRLAAAEGWDRKAGKVAASFDASAGEADAKRSQMFAMCREQAASYRRRGIGTLVLGR